jgi:hypothetical protein
MKKLFLMLMMVAVCGFTLQAQQLFLTTNIQDAYKKSTRNESGAPGINYWQNRGDYDMKIKFEPATNILSGEETIAYYNNSPDSLKKLIIRLYPDFYKKGVQRGTMFDEVKEKDLNDGVTIDTLMIGDETINVADTKKAVHNNTNLIVTPANVVMPHSKLNLVVKWHYTVNTGSQVRTGMVDSGSYFIAYFFPRLAVYDDIDGWDDWSYNGTQEFYNDFGNFNVEISLPKEYVVWATGLRQNAADNFSNAILQKLQQADVSDKIVHVIDSTDYINKDVFSNNATSIWKFKADTVTDFAFAFSNHYLWDASSVITDSLTNKRTLASAAFNPIHKDYFDVASQAHQSVYYMSHYYPHVPFPFPAITVFDGTDQMEYPMMVNDNPTSTHKDAVQLTSHEIFHSYFPFYMGINETQYAWMDEGWATIGESVISPKMGEPEDEGIFSKTRYEKTSGTDKDVPLITNSKLYQDAAYLANSYGKGGLCYWVLQDMLGDSLYFKALHQYINNWHGKHPEPYDFFYSFNTATGKNLNWFWQKWFFDRVYPDLSITKVEQNNGIDKITITNEGGLPVPVYITISFMNGTNKIVHYGADVWKNDKKEIVITEKVSSKIKGIKLGNDFTPDKYEEDNVWEGK